MSDPTAYAMYLRKSEMEVKWEIKNPGGEDPLAKHRRTLTRLAKRNGGTVAEVFADPDKSASKEKVFRPDLERLLVELPRFGGLLAMDIDRVTRNSPVMERVIKVFEANPHLKFLTVDPVRNPDLSTPEGRNTARTLVIRANDESLQTARRMRDMHEDLREEAKPHVGVPGFGMADRTHEDPVQMELIRSAARDVLAGMSVNAIAAQWRAAGVKTPRGADWTGMQVARMLVTPRMAGYRVHKGERYKLAETGEWAMCGPVFLDEDVWLAVCEELGKREKGPHRRPRAYLLSGVCTCGVCSALMSGNVWADGVRYNYRCPKGCVGIAGHHLDGHIEKLLLRRWATAKAAVVEPPVSAGKVEIEWLEGLNADLMARVRAKELALDDAMPTVAENRAQIETLKAANRKAAKARAKAKLADPATEWARLKKLGAVDRLRLMVTDEIDHLVVQPAPEGMKRQWDKDRAQVGWVD